MTGEDWNPHCEICTCDPPPPRPRPDGCVCDPGTWGKDIPPPCVRYDGDNAQYCATCEHDKACHRAEVSS